MKCALFLFHLIEMCLIPMPSKWIVPYSIVTKWNVPYSFSIKLKCSLFLCQKIELCPYYSSKRPTPVFRATRKTEREKHCADWWREKQKSCVWCGGAAILCCSCHTVVLFKIAGFLNFIKSNKNAMYLSRPPGALKCLIRLNVGLRTGYDLG